MTVLYFFFYYMEPRGFSPLESEVVPPLGFADIESGRRDPLFFLRTTAPPLPADLTGFE